MMKVLVEFVYAYLNAIKKKDMDYIILRASGRSYDQMRAAKISYNVFGYAPGSVLFELGNTKVLCSVTLVAGVPPFLKGSRTGWLTAEYAMLPTSCHNRLARESTNGKRNDRAVEISRLIGRALRSIVNLKLLGERTIHVDCDVLQADGSTRTASITGASLALKMAINYWIETKELSHPILHDELVSVSAGLLQAKPILDLDFSEDSTIDADYNFVLTKSEKIIEIQGSAEKSPLSWQQFEQLKELAIKGALSLFATIEQCPYQSSGAVPISNSSLFSLKNRLSKQT